MLTSDELQVGSIYTRADLRQQFGITDQTINNGVFKPQGHDSVWLFITEQKSSDMTPYRDQLVGNTLQWQGQLRGRTDSLIIDRSYAVTPRILRNLHVSTRGKRATA